MLRTCAASTPSDAVRRVSAIPLGREREATTAPMSDNKPVGLVYVGFAWDGGATATNFSWIGTRAEVQRRTAKLALNRVRLHLLRH